MTPSYLDDYDGRQAMSNQTSRDARQKVVTDWGMAAFGLEQMTSIPQRALRLLEEAVELYQAAGADAAMAHRLIDYVFARPVGEVRKELGGVGVCVLAMASACGITAEETEIAEVQRLISRSPIEFTQRNAAKNAAGFAAYLREPLPIAPDAPIEVYRALAQVFPSFFERIKEKHAKGEPLL